MYHVLGGPDAPNGAAPLRGGSAVGGACCGGARASRSTCPFSSVYELGEPTGGARASRPTCPFRGQDTPLS